MKELSIEEKAKRYDSAIEKFDVILNLNTVKESGTIFADDVRKIFPELAELNDEKIRKALVKYFTSKITNPDYEIYGVPFKEVLAWLEKQSSDISLFSSEQRKYMEKYISLDKITLIKLLAERDANNAEIIESFEKQGEQSKKHDVCDTCDEKDSCISPCCVKLVEEQGEQKSNPVLDIEIPFGANDSELQEVSYYIPEGFHAKIEGNRVVIKRSEQKPAEWKLRKG